MVDAEGSGKLIQRTLVAKLFHCAPRRSYYDIIARKVLGGARNHSDCVIGRGYQERTGKVVLCSQICQELVAIFLSREIKDLRGVPRKGSYVVFSALNHYGAYPFSAEAAHHSERTIVSAQHHNGRWSPRPYGTGRPLGSGVR